MLVALTFVVINLDVFLAGNSVAVFRDADEAWYGIVAKRLQTTDCTGVPVTFAFADRPNFHSCAFLKAATAIAPGTAIVSKVSWLKVGTRFITLLLLTVVGHLFFRSLVFGYLVGLVYFVDDGIPVLKPIFWPLKSLLTGELDGFTRSSRLISPMQYAPVLMTFAVLLVIWLRMITLNEVRAKGRRGQNFFFFFATLAAATTVSFTPFYAWISYLYFAGAVLLFLTIKNPSRLMFLPWIAWLYAFTLGLFQGLSKSVFEFSDETLVRSGFFDQQFTPLFLNDKGLLFSLAVFVMLFWKWMRGYAVLFAIGCYLLVNINILTGREYQNFHFRDYLGFLIFQIILWGAWTRFEKTRKPIVCALVISFSLGTAQFVRSQVSKPSGLTPDLAQADLPAIVKFFNRIEGRPNVMCGTFYQVMPLMTDVVCSWHHLLMTYPLSNPELMEFHQAHFRLQGMSDDEVLRFISRDASPNRSLGVWSYGVHGDWIKGTPQIEMYSVRNLSEKIIPLWLDTFRSVNLAKAHSVLKDAEYIILHKGVAADMAATVVPVEVYSVFGIYQWK